MRTAARRAARRASSKELTGCCRSGASTRRSSRISRSRKLARPGEVSHATRREEGRGLGQLEHCCSHKLAVMSRTPGPAVRRADARRNIAAILDAATDCLSRDPQASVATIAKTAGVGRVTLYGHFPTRAELVDAVFARAVRAADEALDGVDLSGDAREALARLVSSSWRLVDQGRAILRAAEEELGAEAIRTHHDRPRERVRVLIERGQREGAFRADLPVEWLVTVFYAVLHGAADEVTAGRLDVPDAGAVITSTLVSSYTPLGAAVPAIPPLSEGAPRPAR
jgi:TetR/AcrR family transcriptional repressor of mexCD-oprJ operon